MMMLKKKKKERDTNTENTALHFQDRLNYSAAVQSQVANCSAVF